MSATGDPGRQPSEEDLRAAYEDQLKQLRVEHIVLDNVVALVNLGLRRTGLSPGTESERDPEQVKLAIEGVRALLPLVEGIAPGEIGQIRNALSQLQLAYVKIGGQPEPEPEPEPEAASEESATAMASGSQPAESPQSQPGEPGPAQRSGRLWTPGS